ncbi:hypothetical protein IRJ41_018359 [Triplophysa rosa]|uniref:Uncharacterized protein n=1 Tax=Triplophysa rosa TaxID=992332 RepID=A0A9W7TTQ5_TRIRA|nr:hypothetical protein IRJ41_018359 [Triplophysa rosa]
MPLILLDNQDTCAVSLSESRLKKQGTATAQIPQLSSLALRPRIQGMPFDLQKDRPSGGGSLNDNIDSLERKKGRGHPSDPEERENLLGEEYLRVVSSHCPQ